MRFEQCGLSPYLISRNIVFVIWWKHSVCFISYLVNNAERVLPAVDTATICLFQYKQYGSSNSVDDMQLQLTGATASVDEATSDIDMEKLKAEAKEVIAHVDVIFFVS